MSRAPCDLEVTGGQLVVNGSSGAALSRRPHVVAHEDHLLSPEAMLAFQARQAQRQLKTLAQHQALPDMQRQRRPCLGRPTSDILGGTLAAVAPFSVQQFRSRLLRLNMVTVDA